MMIARRDHSPYSPRLNHPSPLTEYPAVNDIKTRVTALLSDLYGAPAGTAVGTDTVGSSEGCMLGGMAMKRKWREDRAAQGRRRGVPNIIVGSNVHVAWFKFCDLFDVRISAQRAAFVARTSNLSLSLSRWQRRPFDHHYHCPAAASAHPPRTLLTRPTHPTHSLRSLSSHATLTTPHTTPPHPPHSSLLHRSTAASSPSPRAPSSSSPPSPPRPPPSAPPPTATPSAW